MFDASDDAKGGFRRVEILTGPGRRRRWSAEDKARIIAETLVAGSRVSEVARRWQLSPQQVFGWRRAARLAMTTATTGGSIASDAPAPWDRSGDSGLRLWSPVPGHQFVDALLRPTVH